MNLYPLKFQPLYKYRIWGGEKLRTVLHKKYEGDKIGESWEISDVKGDETPVLDGHLKGKTLKQLIHTYKEKLVGEKVHHAFGDSFPLLIKFIDAALPLSVQVHPDDNVARKRHDSFGKNEMWYVMDADENAELIVGFKENTTSSEYLSKLEQGEILDLLNVEKVKSEDVYYISAGRIHAIGAGVLLAEIQQTSDITYRIYDYNRVDETTGKTRALHNELAVDVIDFKAYPEYKTEFSKNENTTNTLVHSPYFKSDFLRITTSSIRDYSKLDSFVIYVCVNGVGKIVCDEIQYSLQKGETMLIPAEISHIEIIPDGGIDIIEVYL